MLARDGTTLLEDDTQKTGRPKIEWLREHYLGPSAHPVQWLDVMFSRKEHSYERKRNKKWERVSIVSYLKNYTNLKALLCHAGYKMYKGRKDLTTAELWKFVGLYVLDGVGPSPRVEIKFKTRAEDPVNGNDLCSEMFGSNVMQRLKMFKCFFSA